MILNIISYSTKSSNKHFQAKKIIILWASICNTIYFFPRSSNPLKLVTCKSKKISVLWQIFVVDDFLVLEENSVRNRTGFFV